jgi:hypothetical protein
VPASLSTYLACQTFNPDLIISAGTAGGFKARVRTQFWVHAECCRVECCAAGNAQESTWLDAFACAVRSRQLPSPSESCILQTWVDCQLLSLTPADVSDSCQCHVGVFVIVVQGAGVGDVFVSTGKMHHDRRIPLPGFDKQVGHCCMSA